MAGATIKLVPAGTDKIDQELLRMINAVRDPQAAFREIGERLDLGHRQRWDKAQAPDGTAWAPLSAVSKARKSKRKLAPGILVASTDLRDTLRYQVTVRGLLFGTDRKYGAVQQFGARQGVFGRSRRGGPLPWGNIPARPWLGVSDGDAAAIRTIIKRHIEGLG